MLEFDEETASRIEAMYSTPDVVEQRRIVGAHLALAPGERVLDIGTGPGFVAADLARAVGPQGAVHGVDVSESMLEVARRRVVEPGSARVELHTADALSLPFPDAGFDAALSTQVYEYVDDLPRALLEARRVLRGGGRLLVLDTDWDSIVWHSDDEARMRRVLGAWDEHLAHPHLPRRLPGLLREAGFEQIDCVVIPFLNNGYDADTYSAGLIDIVSAFVPGRQGLEPADVDAWARELVGLGDDYFFSICRYLFSAVA